VPDARIRPHQASTSLGYGPWLVSKINPALPHTQAIVLVSDRKHAAAVEAQLIAIGQHRGVTALSLSHAYSCAGPESQAARDSIHAGHGPHIAIAPPYSAFNTAESSPEWREQCQRHVTALAVDGFEIIAGDPEMLQFCEEVGSTPFSRCFTPISTVF